MICSEVSANRPFLRNFGKTYLALAHGVHRLLDIGNDQIIDRGVFGKRVPELDQGREESREGRGLGKERRSLTSSRLSGTCVAYLGFLGIGLGRSVSGETATTGSVSDDGDYAEGKENRSASEITIVDVEQSHRARCASKAILLIEFFNHILNAYRSAFGRTGRTATLQDPPLSSSLLRPTPCKPVTGLYECKLPSSLRRGCWATPLRKFGTPL